jgi:hypothetical protein
VLERLLGLLIHWVESSFLLATVVPL